jgi:hypothetical protein
MPKVAEDFESTATRIDPTIRLRMDQSFADNHVTMTQLGSQALQAANFVNEQAQLTHLRTGLAFEVKAINNLEQEGMADAILQERSAAGQPGAPSGFPAPFPVMNAPAPPAPAKGAKE